MEKEIIEVTPEWILRTISYLSSVKVNAFVTAFYDEELELICMALDTLKISYVVREGDDADDYTYGIEFRLEDIKTDCPSLYSYLTSDY